MPRLPDGQGGVIETGYVVARLETAAQRWQAALGVGHFEIHEQTQPLPVWYRGQRINLEMRVALGAVNGHIVELIELCNDVDSVYAEVVRLRGYGFHHWGYLAHDFDAAFRGYEAAGYDCIQMIEMASYGRVSYHDALESMGGNYRTF